MLLDREAVQHHHQEEAFKEDPALANHITRVSPL